MEGLAAHLRRFAEATKRRDRAATKYSVLVNKLKSLPGVKNVVVNANYVNPVTLEAPPRGVVVYHIKDPKTGRVDLFDKVTFWKLLRRHSPNIKNNYNLLMAMPSRVLFPNPTTRTGITTRNIQRVRARPKPKTPSRSAAAAKIANALRKKLAAKKAAAKKPSPAKKNVRKTPSPAKKNVRKTPSPAKKNNTRKSH
jgi:hypothetical protein